jgi:hypothetical protein
MKKILSAVLFVMAIGLTGCEEQTTTPNTPTGTNYFPMTQGSHWTYEITADFGDTVLTSTETKTISGDSTVNGKKYFQVNSSDSEYPEFIRRSGDTVFTLSEEGIDEIMSIERKGASWERTFSSEGLRTTVTFTVLEKGINRSVMGKTYNDVLHVQGIGSIAIGNQTSEMEFNGYFAKGVGPIEETTPFTVAKLKSHSIK